MDWRRIFVAIVLSVLGVSAQRPAVEPVFPALPDGWRVFTWYEPQWDEVWWAGQRYDGIHEIVLVTTTAETTEQAAEEVAQALHYQLWPCSEPIVVTAEQLRRDWAEAVRQRNAAEEESPSVEELLWLWDLWTRRGDQPTSAK